VKFSNADTAMKKIISAQQDFRFGRYFFLAGMIALLVFVSSCSIYRLYVPRKVCHAGFSVVVPGDWGDYTETNREELAVERIWGTCELTIEKLPGQSEYLLSLFRKTMPKEEAITEWHGLNGRGFSFRRNDEETVIFFPEEKFPGWYIEAAVQNDENGAGEAFNKVIHSLKREKEN
jgi:hypothetical protein